MSTYYAELGVSESCPPDAVRSAFRSLIRKWHPDANPENREAAAARTRALIEAYEVLKDAHSRSEYDHYLHDLAAQGGRAGESVNCQASAAQGTSPADQPQAAANGSSGFADASEAGKRAATQAEVESHWSLDEILEAAWKGSPDYQAQPQFGALMLSGCWGWIIIGLVALLMSGIGTIPAIFTARMLWFTGGRALAPDGRFVGFGTLLAGVAFWLAIAALGIGLLIAAASPRATTSGRHPGTSMRGGGAASSAFAANHGVDQSLMPTAERQFVLGATSRMSRMLGSADSTTDDTVEPLIPVRFLKAFPTAPRPTVTMNRVKGMYIPKTLPEVISTSSNGDIMAVRQELRSLIGLWMTTHPIQDPPAWEEPAPNRVHRYASLEIGINGVMRCDYVGRDGAWIRDRTASATWQPYTQEMIDVSGLDDGIRRSRRYGYAVRADGRRLSLKGDENGPIIVGEYRKMESLPGQHRLETTAPR